jgi:hypothetical protein
MNMLDQFTAYVPSSWYDQAGLMKKMDETKARVAKDGEGFAARARGMSMSVLAVVTGLFMFAAPAAASNEFAIPVAVPGSAAQPTSIVEINNSFDSLFASLREGKRLVHDKSLIALAERAAAGRNQRPSDIDSWAARLAGDIKDAND